MSIGKKLLSLRQQKGLSQQELADYLHVSRQTISKWESDLSLPDMKMSLTIAQFYEISITELLGIEEETSEQSLNQIYEKTSIVLDNMQKEFKRRKMLDISVILVCIISLITSLVLLVKSENRNQQTINNNYYQNTEETDVKNNPKVVVESYHLDTMSAKVSITFTENEVDSNASAYIYLKDQDNNEFKYPMILTESNAFEYNGHIPLEHYEESVIVLDNAGKRNRYEWDINNSGVNDSFLLRACFTLSVPYRSGQFDDDVVKYTMVKSVNGIPIRGALDASIYIKINSSEGDTLFLQTINSHYTREFSLRRSLKYGEKLVVQYEITQGDGRSVSRSTIEFKYPKSQNTDFYIINRSNVMGYDKSNIIQVN